MTHAPHAPTAPAGPLASPEPWDLVRDGYVSELWEQFSFFARAALDLVPLREHAHVLDVCTGPGTLALPAATRASRVVAVDFSPRMLDELERRTAQAGLSHVIERLEANGQALPLEDASFDAAFSMFGLIFFPDRLKGIRELHRVLKPGGHVALSSWRPFDTVPPIKLAFTTLIELMPDLPFGKSKAPLGEPEEFSAELAAGGFESVAIHEVSYESVARNAEAFWASMARSTAPFVLLRRRLGEAAWERLSDQVLERFQHTYGEAPIPVRLQALIGTGMKA